MGLPITAFLYEEDVMKILHTADWHLGRIFYQRHLTEEQGHVLKNQFLPLLREKEIDAVVIAGDIFDRAVPPVEAIRLWDEIVTAIVNDYKIPLFVIAGNHDGGERLQLNKHLLRKHGVYVEGIMSEVEPITLQDEWGPVHFCLFPFGDPLSYREVLGEDTELEEGDNSYDAATRTVVEEMKKKLPVGERSVAVAHAFLAGGMESASERPISLGASSVVGANIFADFSYTALGHLHGPQRVGDNRIRYSGSLLPYSFGEEHQKKSFTIVHLGEDSVEVELVPISPLRKVRVLEGTLQELLDMPVTEDYVFAKLTDTTPVIDGMAQLRRRHPYVMGMELVGRMALNENGERGKFKHLEERDLFKNFAGFVWKDGLTEEQESYMNELWEEVRKEEV